nr:hypothetical protein JVH1_6960 [Rhodococcus sp. JVH1]
MPLVAAVEVGIVGSYARIEVGDQHRRRARSGPILQAEKSSEHGLPFDDGTSCDRRSTTGQCRTSVSNLRDRAAGEISLRSSGRRRAFCVLRVIRNKSGELLETRVD